VVTQVSAGGLTSVEKSLVEHVACGEPLDLAADEAVDVAAMRSWGDSRTCRASVIRDILRGQKAKDPDPHGLRLRGARITVGLICRTSSPMSTSNWQITSCVSLPSPLPLRRCVHVMRGSAREHCLGRSLWLGLAGSCFELGANLISFGGAEGQRRE
jgi:hypothetical protein